VQRIIERSAELTKRDPNGDARAQGGVDLPTIQKWITYWFSYSIDLFGGEISSNAADFFASGVKGRWKEEKYDDHRALDRFLRMPIPRDGRLVDEDVPLRNAMNEVLRAEYEEDCQRVLVRWNRVLQETGITDFQFRLPSHRFHRRQGIYADSWYDPYGTPITREQFEARRDEWLPSEADRAFVASLMHGVPEPGKMAHWIAPPRKGINNLPPDFSYVRSPVT
jgi:benzoyl-CoA 2,3-dioxygenase component B